MTKLDCNIENMTKLVEVLESGEYQQARRALRVGDKFCCLGVACDIAAKEGLGEWAALEDGEWRFEHQDLSEGTEVLPNGVRKWLGVDRPSLNLTDWWDYGFVSLGEIFHSSASDMNDNGSDFTQIAAAIRKAYL
jgi:hypothetical protein